MNTRGPLSLWPKPQVINVCSMDCDATISNLVRVDYSFKMYDELI